MQAGVLYSLYDTTLILFGISKSLEGNHTLAYLKKSYRRLSLNMFVRKILRTETGLLRLAIVWAEVALPAETREA